MTTQAQQKIPKDIIISSPLATTCRLLELHQLRENLVRRNEKKWNQDYVDAIVMCGDAIKRFDTIGVERQGIFVELQVRMIVAFCEFCKKNK